MASVPIQITGVIYDKTLRTARPVVIVGDASLEGVGVGGGPIIPPQGGGEHPEHPIVIPPTEPVEPPVPPSQPKPPPETGGWGYVPGWGTTGWGYFPSAEEASPK